MVETFGDPESISFAFSWPDAISGATSADATTGRLTLTVANKVAWGLHDDGFEWTWIELAESLAESWPSLLWDQDFPLGSRAGSVRDVEVELRRRWDLLSEPVREFENAEYYDFLEYHDLASALQGALAAPVWLVRQGEITWICTDETAVRANTTWLLDVLSRVAEAIVERAMFVGDDRANALRDAWDNRVSLPLDIALSIATSLDDDSLRKVEGDRDRQAFWELRDTANPLNELTAAARMASALPVTEIREIVSLIRETGTSQPAEIDDLAEKAEIASGPPYDEGYSAAVWLRSQIGLSEDDPADPRDMLQKWGVPTHELSIESSSIDALAFWGPSHGPAILINSDGLHNKSDAGRRATLAHEIAHLLLDRRESLPLAEVLGGRTPSRSEERARAFAAEFLLPREVAGRAFAVTENPGATLRSLQRKYSVSAEVIAWQARNSSAILRAEVRSYLRGRVSQPWRF